MAEETSHGAPARHRARTLPWPDGWAPLVYIASHVRLYREALAGSLIRHGGLRVAGQGFGDEALAELVALQPDVLLLDLSASNSLAVPRRAQQSCPGLRVVAFAVAEVDTDVLACAKAGICGYVAQDGSVADVVDTVLRAVAGELVCPPGIAALLFRRVAILELEDRLAQAPLTAREEEIAALLAYGLSNKHIARRLCVSGATVKNHVHNILQKLKLERRSEVAAQHSTWLPWAGVGSGPKATPPPPDGGRDPDRL